MQVSRALDGPEKLVEDMMRVPMEIVERQEERVCRASDIGRALTPFIQVFSHSSTAHEMRAQGYVQYQSCDGRVDTSLLSLLLTSAAKVS